MVFTRVRRFERSRGAAPLTPGVQRQVRMNSFRPRRDAGKRSHEFEAVGVAEDVGRIFGHVS